VLWAAAAVCLFAFIYLSGKLTGGTTSALQIMWLRYVGGLLTVVVLVAFSGDPWQVLKTRQAGTHFARAATGGIGGVAAIYAASVMPVATASALGLLDGMFAMVLGVVLLRERISATQVMASSLCLAGAMIVLFGKGASTGLSSSNLLAIFVALAGALAVAVESVLIKRLSTSETAVTVLLYVNLFGVLLFAPLALFEWTAVSPSTLLLMLSLGPIAVVAQTCNIVAYRHADVALIAPVRYLWILFAAAFGYVLFGERPTPTTYLGAACLILGGIWLTRTRSDAAMSRSMLDR
jgi:drug/metabolite transporter (DMT)-like permease